ncbi:VCBS repeat-containing protein [Flagellimonas onchidii]|uniref:VCBS repeat-containing protein n=1 Tax=Flagellimonas onchidii TaxID=2562684 RepID=UPI0014561DF8|nr:VCBS repeat-containing protein [Allomuricauda onchidii]
MQTSFGTIFYKGIISILIVVVIGSCKNKGDIADKLEPFGELSFALVEPSHSGIQFENKITEGKRLNYFTYPNIYSGGGVAVGDLDNDGLADIYFSGNMVENKLYKNKGNMQFEDVTSKAGVAALDVVRWTRGVTMVDINNDGLLDIYVSVSDPPGRRNNLLYVNQGGMIFKEMASDYGIDDNSNSVQSVFFDYDRDGDLDLYISVYPPFNLYNSNPFFKEKNENPSLEESDRLYRNEGNGKFTEITEEAGVLNYGLTLNASISDFNSDGWYDIYVSNDFNAKDFLYINQQDGTFKDELEDYFPHTSNFGMGTDAADFNNDGYMDLFQSDMMSDSNIGKKTNMSAMNPEIFNEALTSGLHYQFMRNTLQLNNGNGTFSDIAEISGVGYTDWSWAPLFVDLNNDGWKDLFVSNGMRRNVNNNDYLIFSSRLFAQKKITPENQHRLVEYIPENPVDNYVFINTGELGFKKEINNWGLSYEGFTHGVAYADFDKDGDLDMVFNNQDAKALIFENKARQVFENQNYVRLKLKGGAKNRNGLGAKVSLVTTDGSIQTQEFILSRGYQSSVEPVMHFGLGKIKGVDAIHINWPDGTLQKFTDIKVNQELLVEKEMTGTKELFSTADKHKDKSFSPLHVNIDYQHKENLFDDFERESLLPHKMSQFGPAMAVGDVNGDGLEDLYIGGAKDQSGSLQIQQANGSFIESQQQYFETDENQEDTGALFFDADKDGDLDLYVVSGGNEVQQGNEYYNDRFYENIDGVFYKKTDAIPTIISSGSCVVPCDFDKDGDIDLFVGGRQVPGRYPSPASSTLLLNESDKGEFTFRDVTMEMAPMLEDIGMVTSAVWLDIDNDTYEDLVFTGEWMPIKMLKNHGNMFTDISESSGLMNETGWWNALAYADFDNDGDFDLIGGNLGKNYKYKADYEHPFKIYAKDFDDNNTFDIVLGFYEKDELYPLRGRECSSNQMPFIKKKFKTYDAFAKASLTEVYGEENLGDAIRYEAKNFASSYFENLGDGTFKTKPLPQLAQISSINDIEVGDFDSDGHLDAIVAGNLLGSEVETPRNDASYGVFLKGDGKGGFTAKFPYESGLNVNGEVKQIEPINLSNMDRKSFVFTINNNKLVFYSVETPLDNDG